MLKPWTVVIALHAIAASVALVLGAVQIVRPTKGDQLHRLMGRVWAGLMLFVSATSFFFGGGTSPLDIFLRLLAIFTLGTVTLGVLRARRGSIRGHARAMVGTYLGLLAAFVGVISVRTRLVPSWFLAHLVTMSLVAIAIIAVTGFLVGGLAFGTRHSRMPQDSRRRAHPAGGTTAGGVRSDR